MIDPEEFYSCLKEQGVEFFTGVPDSLLKCICGYITDNTPKNKHIIAANEGGAVALASGYHTATGKVPLVYLQNSGLGNTVNPILSLADKEVYGIPVIMMIGWRGCPQADDQPQHIKQGRIQNDLLKDMDIPFKVLGPDTRDIDNFIRDNYRLAEDNSSPAAIVVKPNTFKKYKLKSWPCPEYKMTREDAIKQIIDTVTENDIIVSTTGKASREVYEYREAKEQDHRHDFMTVGSMGHASGIALGIALNTDRKVVCLDGDGALLMHMGNLAIIGMQKPENFVHVVLNNGCHDSVGGQPSAGFDINLQKIVLGCGYVSAGKVKTAGELQKSLKSTFKRKGPAMIEVKIKRGSRPDLGRPDLTPRENKEALINLLNETGDRDNGLKIKS